MNLDSRQTWELQKHLFYRKSFLLLCAKHLLQSWESISIAPNFLQQAWSQLNHLQEQLFSWKQLWTQLIRSLCVWQAPCHVKGTKRQHRMCTHSSNPHQHCSGSWQRHPHESRLPRLALLVREWEQSLAPNTPQGDSLCSLQWDKG